MCVTEATHAPGCNITLDEGANVVFNNIMPIAIPDNTAHADFVFPITCRREVVLRRSCAADGR